MRGATRVASYRRKAQHRPLLVSRLHLLLLSAESCTPPLKTSEIKEISAPRFPFQRNVCGPCHGHPFLVPLTLALYSISATLIPQTLTLEPQPYTLNPQTLVPQTVVTPKTLKPF